MAKLEKKKLTRATLQDDEFYIAAKLQGNGYKTR